MITARPILFSAPMVRALLEGRKTQTRRIVKGAPVSVVTLMKKVKSLAPKDRQILLYWPSTGVVREGRFECELAGFFRGDEYWWYSARTALSARSKRFRIQPTHWMPLPDGPDQTDREPR